MGKVVSVISGKGGVGKTALSCYISEYLCQKGNKVVAVDGDMGLSNLDMAFNVSEEIVYNIADVLERRCSPEKALVKTPAGPYYLAAASNTIDKKTLAPLKFLLGALSNHFDFTIIDCPTGMGDTALSFALCSDLILVVTDISHSSIRDAARMADKIRQIDNKEMRLIINKINKHSISKKNAPDINTVIDEVSVRLIGVLPEEGDIAELQDSGLPLFKSGLKAVKRQISDIGDRISGRHIPLKKI